MSMASTRFGATDPSLPAVLPSMTSALTRRRALFGAMVLGMTPAAAVPALAAPSPDAELLDLIAQHPVAVDRWVEARKAADAVERAAIAARPERPEALLSRPTDFPGSSFALGLSEPADADGRRWYGTRGVAWLRRPRVFRSWSADASEMVPDPEAEARRAEILEASDAWEAACSEADRRAGLDDAEESVEAAYDVLSAIEDRLNGLAPRTLAGLAAKAAWAAGSEDEGVMEAVLHQVAAFSLAV